MIDVLKDDEAALFVIARFSVAVDIVNGFFKCDLDNYKRSLKALWLVETNDENDFIVEYNGERYYLFVLGELSNHPFILTGDICAKVIVHHRSFMRVNSVPQPLFTGNTKHPLDFPLWIS